MTAQIPDLNLGEIGAREVLEALPDGAYLTNTQRRIVFWNRAAQRITGWQPNEVVGHTCSDNVLVHVDKDGHQLCGAEDCPLRRAIVTGEVSSEPLLVFAQHRQGRRIPVEVSVGPLRNQRGQTVGGIEVFRDLAKVMDDLRRAKLIQDHALDSSLPKDERVQFQAIYSPAEIVGGDFYRAEPVGPDQCAVMVADVMGHGVASALFTMQLRSLWEECRPHLRSPAGFLGELDRRLHKLASADGYFATAFFLLLDAVSGRLSYVRAGHPPAFVFRAAGPVETLSIRSPALGLIGNATYAQGEAQLAPGDTVLLFTDGAFEITSASGQDLGVDGFRRLLEIEGFGAGEVTLERIEQRLLEYSNQIRLPDDLTLLSIRRPV